jgi:predicted peroxiredoxin
VESVLVLIAPTDGEKKMKLARMAVFFLAPLFAINTAATAQNPHASEAPHAGTSHAVVHLSHFTDDLHRAFMAVKIANMMQAGGVQTTMFLDIEGARIADTRQSLEMRWGPSQTTLAEYYAKFTAAGGKVVVCPHCATAAGLNSQSVRKGAEIGTEEQLAQIFLAADKIMDY